MVVTRWCQKPTKQPAFDPVSFITHFVFVNKHIHRCKCFVLASLLQAGEGNQQNNQLTSPFLLLCGVILPNRITYRYISSLLASVLLSRIFPTNGRVCLNMRHLCFVDNWLHDPISEN